MNKKTWLSAGMRLIEFDNMDIIAAFRDANQPTLDPNDAEIL